MAALLSALLALARAVPALEALFRDVVKQIDAERAREAVRRQGEKDARVDDAIAKVQGRPNPPE